MGVLSPCNYCFPLCFLPLELEAPTTPMDLPVSDLSPMKYDAASFLCDHCDAELVHRIAQLLLLGLSTACVDSTTGVFFRTPACVAVDLRKQMVDYITYRSETYVSEFLLRAQESSGSAVSAPEDPPDNPADIVVDLMEDFAATKRNLFSRISSWILSDRREDKIDDFVQVMEMNRFWKINRRGAVAEVLLRNLDYKKVSHCWMKFQDDQKLLEHKAKCGFRPVNCSNEGCKVQFCAVHQERHDSVCPYKVLPCEQKCTEMILRREMDRHCVTVCPMRLIDCPFYQVGCESVIPQCTLEQHCREYLRTHLMCVLPAVHRNEEASENGWKEHADVLEKTQNGDELSEVLDLISLATVIKNLEAKMKKNEVDQSNDS